MEEKRLHGEGGGGGGEEGKRVVATKIYSLLLKELINLAIN